MLGDEANELSKTTIPFIIYNTSVGYNIIFLNVDFI